MSASTDSGHAGPIVATSKGLLAVPVLQLGAEARFVAKGHVPPPPCQPRPPNTLTLEDHILTRARLYGATCGQAGRPPRVSDFFRGNIPLGAARSLTSGPRDVADGRRVEALDDWPGIRNHARAVRLVSADRMVGGRGMPPWQIAFGFFGKIRGWAGRDFSPRTQRRCGDARWSGGLRDTLLPILGADALATARPVAARQR
jgi:hypothetical protein